MPASQQAASDEPERKLTPEHHASTCGIQVEFEIDHEIEPLIEREYASEKPYFSAHAMLSRKHPDQSRRKRRGMFRTRRTSREAESSLLLVGLFGKRLPAVNSFPSASLPSADE